MSISIKIRNKLSPYRNSTADLSSSKSISNRNSFTSSKIELSTTESIKILQALKVANQPISLQIPSLRGPDPVDSISKENQKKSVNLKGYYSKVNLKTHKNILKEKKKLKTSRRLIESADHNTLKSSARASEKTENIEMNFLEGNNCVEGKLEKKLFKALKENIRLKKIMNEEISSDYMIEKMMKSFRSRLKKFLYE